MCGGVFVFSLVYKNLVERVCMGTLGTLHLHKLIEIETDGVKRMRIMSVSLPTPNVTL